MEGEEVCSDVGNGETGGSFQAVALDVLGIVRTNPDSRAFVELDGCQFKRMFVAFGASLNGFILGCRKISFVDVTHLSGPYKGTMLAAVALDADNHIFDAAYVVVGGEINDNWLWFLTMLHDCLGGLKPAIMSDRNKGLLAIVPLVFRKENHSYCMRHLMENLMGEASKLGIRVMHRRSSCRICSTKLLMQQLRLNMIVQ